MLHETDLGSTWGPIGSAPWVANAWTDGTKPVSRRDSNALKRPSWERHR